MRNSPSPPLKALNRCVLVTRYDATPRATWGYANGDPEDTGDSKFRLELGIRPDSWLEGALISTRSTAQTHDEHTPPMHCAETDSPLVEPHCGQTGERMVPRS